jgi:folate-binding protein YgfZ
VEPLVLHEQHQSLGATFNAVSEGEVVQHYGDALAEHQALTQAAGLLDLSFRGRLCLTGADRLRFLNGQVTNNVKVLQPGSGCYAALVTARGKLESDLNIHCLLDELLLDFEPGLTERVVSRFERFIVADDVAVVDVKPHVGLLSVQGPRATEALGTLNLVPSLPDRPFASVTATAQDTGEMVVVNVPRFGTSGYDLFVSVAGIPVMFERLREAVSRVGGRTCGWQAMELARIEAGIPRFGQDMDDSNIPLESGLEERAVNYSKGCYIGQEVINRIHTIGQVAKALRGLHLDRTLATLPPRGARLFHDGKDVGQITSAIVSPTLGFPVAMGYVRREVNQPGTRLTLLWEGRETEARIVPLPFVSASVVTLK